MRELILGADGGGTKTKLVAVDARTGAEVAKAIAGSIHVHIMGMETAVANMQTAIRGLRLSRDDRILALGIGDPALDDRGEDTKEPFRQQLLSRGVCPAETVCVTKSDVFMALYAFSGGKPAALIAAGTGSMGVAFQKPYRHGGKNAILTVGGWGLPANDPGSAYDIAVRGIAAAMDAFDGIAPPTMLCEAALRFFGAASPRAMIDVFNGDPLPRNEIAAFAREVDACALSGDRIAADILMAAGEALGKYAICLLRGIDTPSRRIGIYGSVLLHNQSVREAFACTVQTVFPNTAVCVPEKPPEYGAVAFAAHALGIHWEE